MKNKKKTIRIRRKIFILSYLFLAFSFYSCINKNSEKSREQLVKDSIELIKQKDAEIEKNAIIKADQLRKDSIRNVEHEKLIKNSIKITSYYLSSPNSASGVDANFYFKNLSKKAIKYCTWEGYPINAVGDIVSCDISDRSSFRGECTGPIKSGRKDGGCWECAWYNWTAKKLILTGIEIEYMDGTTLEITGDDLYLIGKKRS